MENQSQRTIVWEVQYLSPPPAVRFCKRCGMKKEYFSSGQFRVNAQRKYLDIWLIYKCSGCESTWNMTILTRVHPKALSKKLLDKFQSNDKTLADQYAMDTNLLRQNGCKTGPYHYEVTGCNTFDGPVRLHIKCNFASDIKISAILREKLHLSRKEFEKMIAEDRIKSESGADLRKCRLKDNINGHVLFLER